MAEHEEKDLGTQGTADTVKGKLNKAAGTVQKKAGQVTGNKEMEMKGKAREVGGNVQSHVGDAERTIEQKLKADSER